MGSDVGHLRRHIIYKSDRFLEIDVVSDKELHELKRYGKIGCKSEVTGYTKDAGQFSRPIYRKKYFYK
jgi:hypothetical protein